MLMAWFSGSEGRAGVVIVLSRFEPGGDAPPAPEHALSNVGDNAGSSSSGGEDGEAGRWGGAGGGGVPVGAGAGRWSDPVTVSAAKGRSNQNPVLFRRDLNPNPNPNPKP
jgi:hypothetical protein